MNAHEKILDFRSLARTEGLRPAAVITAGTVLVVIHRYAGSPPFGPGQFAGTGNFDTIMLMFLAAFFLFGVVPALAVRPLLGEPLRSVGLRIGDWKAGMKMIAVAYPVIAVAMLLPAAYNPEIRDFYPFDKAALVSWGAFARVEVARIVVYYTAWEFLFRGFMLFGLEKPAGPWIAIAVQTIPSCLWHIGMPTGEIVSSVAGGFLFGIMALRTRSILWPLILHSMIGVTLDCFIVLTT